MVYDLRSGSFGCWHESSPVSESIGGARRFDSPGAEDDKEVLSDCEFLEVRLGRPILLRLVDEEEREMGSLNLDLLGGGKATLSSGSRKAYNPVSGSASGAQDVIVDSGKLALPIESLPDNLSLSTTEKLREYVCSCRMTWNTIFSSNTGFKLWRITRVRYVFRPREATTNGSISKEVLVTAAI